MQNGELRESKQMPVSLSYDHRVVNGAYAAKFISELSNQLNKTQFLEEIFHDT